MITSWSYSRWATYEECPAKAGFKFVQKLPEPQGPAAARGDDIHKKLESYLLSGGKLPAEANQLKTFYTGLRKIRPAVELQVAYDRAWKAVEWFSKAAWARIKIDVLEPPVIGDDPPEVVITDHKTGGIDKRTGKLKDQKEEEYLPQLQLYGLTGLMEHEIAERARAQLAFVDAGVVKPDKPVIFLRKDVPALKKLWESRTKKMLSDTKFTPKPGFYCNYCAFAKKKGGPCPW
jgi:hypothetical protein